MDINSSAGDPFKGMSSRLCAAVFPLLRGREAELGLQANVPSYGSLCQGQKKLLDPEGTSGGIVQVAPLLGNFTEKILETGDCRM